MNKMKRLYSFETRVGTFYIAYCSENRRYHALYEDEPLGSYTHPELAAGDLAGGHTCSISAGVDTSELGIPDDLCEWNSFRCA